jgi:hypothetical protein
MSLGRSKKLGQGGNGLGYISFWYADGVYWGITNTTKENKEAVTDAVKAGLEVNTEKTKYTLISHCQNAGQNITQRQLIDLLNVWE